MNAVILSGRLTKDIELRQGTKTDYARFTVAVDREREDDAADFIRCMCFGNLAKALSAHCQKGRQVLVSGRLNVTKGTDGKYYHDVMCNRIEFLAKPKKSAV